MKCVESLKLYVCQAGSMLAASQLKAPAETQIVEAARSGSPVHAGL
jgi:hypothetical protein